MSDGINKFYDEVNKYTKYKIVERITKNHKFETLDSLEKIEKLTEDIMAVMSLCGLKFYGELKRKSKK